MKTIKYVSLNDALFLGGKNHGLKIVNGNGVTIEHDPEEDHVKITYKNEMATIKHYGSIVEDIGQAVKRTVGPLGSKPIRAQASTPHDHVFAETPGKTRDS